MSLVRYVDVRDPKLRLRGGFVIDDVLTAVLCMRHGSLWQLCKLLGEVKHD